MLRIIKKIEKNLCFAEATGGKKLDGNIIDEKFPKSKF